MILFFREPTEWRRWLEKHHQQKKELWVGFYKRKSGRASLTWPQAVDEALCFGWIDGVRQSIDETRYKNRFTPRKTTSNWSAINIARVKELRKQGRMHPAGWAAFEKRSDEKSRVYSYEQRKAAALSAADQRKFESSAAAWRYFQAQAPWYRRAAIHWVVSAKKEETRARRLQTLIDCSADGRSIPPLVRR